MSRLGYLETQGSTKRLRMVQPGYDADDSATPPNKVIFDSNDLGTLSLLQAGEKTWTNVDYEINETIVTWDYDFVPLCRYQFYNSDWDSYAVSNAWMSYMDVTGSGTGGPLFRVSKTGILVRGRFDNFTKISSLKIRWWAFRLKAA